jgi:hypothetical protein
VIDALHAISVWLNDVAVLADAEVFEELQHLDYDHTKLLDNSARYKAGKPDSVPEGVDLIVA